MIKPSEIVGFWREAGPAKWFKKDEAFDNAIRARFETAHQAGARGAFADWEASAEGSLALLLLLDQFPRNMYRGSGHQFATDGLARAIARRAIARSLDHEVEPELRGFFYLPFEHSEDARDQQEAVQLFEAAGDAELIKWAKLHADIIARFGRFPHRNDCLGRESTEAEKLFLKEGGFAG